MGKGEEKTALLKSMIEELPAGKAPGKLEAVLDGLPVDISFVDQEDKVRQFKQSKARIFPRAKAVIGGSVQKCHPQKSVYLVNQILDDSQNGPRDRAEFWIQMGPRLVHARRPLGH